MSRIRKLLGLLLCLLLVIGLSGCGNNAPSGGAPGATGSQPAGNVPASAPAEPVAVEGQAVADDTYTYFIHYDYNRSLYEIARVGMNKNDTPEMMLYMRHTKSLEQLPTLVLYRDYIYFPVYDESMYYPSLYRMTKEGKDMRKMESFLKEVGEHDSLFDFFTDRHYMYYTLTDFCDHMYRFDLETGEETRIDLAPLTSGNAYTLSIIGVHDDTMYYCKDSDDPTIGVVNGIFYSSVSSLSEKELCPIDTVYTGIYMNPCQFSGNYMFVVDAAHDEKPVYSIDLTTGQTRQICTISNSTSGNNFRVRGDEVYYFVGSDLWKTSLNGENTTLVIEDPDKDNRKQDVVIAGDWLYYKKYGHESPYFFRVSLTEGRIFPDTRFCEPLNQIEIPSGQ